MTQNKSVESVTPQQVNVSFNGFQA